IESLMNPRQQPRSGLRELQPGPLPRHNRHSEPSFERGQSMARSRLRHSNPPRGFHEALLLGDRRDQTQALPRWFEVLHILVDPFRFVSYRPQADNRHMDIIRFGVIGDFNPSNPTHVGTNTGLEHAGPCTIDWLSTEQLQDYSRFDAMICSPGSP